MEKPSFIVKNEPLAKHCTLGVGGPADYLAVVKEDDELFTSCEFARDNKLDCFAMGRGSNILFADSGLRGMVLYMALRQCGFGGNEFWVDAGVLVSEIVSVCERAGFAGFEFLAGLPGTVGGALYGNAGCYGGQFWDRVMAVKYFDGEHLRVKEVGKTKDKLFDYRWSIFKDHPGWIIISVQLEMGEAGDPGPVIEKTREIRAKRHSNQPNEKSLGCFFQNPIINGERISAGKLLDKSGLKGTKVGGAMISPIHANFFVNCGGARAVDFLELIKIAKGHVFGRFNVLLKEEIIEIGEF